MDALIERAIAYVQVLFSGNSGGHDASHTMRVYHNAMLLSSHYPECDVETVALAALLHDADDGKLFKTSDFANARNFLHENGLTEARIDEICSVISMVSFSLNKGKKPDTIEAKLVQDADRLDAIGAIGIARTFAYGGEHRRPMFSTIQHFHKKLLLLKELMNTPEARTMAEERHRFMERFLAQYQSELGETECVGNKNREP